MFKTLKRHLIVITILFVILYPYSITNASNLSFNETVKIPREENELKNSDIAGTDLYSEKIDAYVAGNKSIVKQSLFTNDTSILTHFDTKDQAFSECNLLISASNGIAPKIFPRLITENNFSNQFSLSFNGFSGFLYYEDEVTENEAKIRADRALELIKRKFEIDLIMINVSETNFFPFIGYYPDWDTFLREISTNLPKDGYWKALDINRLSNENYYSNYHLSSTFLLLNSLDFFENDIFESLDQVNFNLDSLDLTFIYNIEMQDLFEQFLNTIENFETLFGNITLFMGENQTLTQEDLEQFSEFFNILSLSNESQYASLMIQYEGIEESIQKLGDNQYKFDFWNALNYSGEAIRPSEKVFNALSGAFMSDININILCTDIVETTPESFKLYDYLLQQIELILFYGDIDFDVDLIREYIFELFWVDQGGIKQSYIKPINPDDPTDIINYLPLLGLQGLPSVPTGIFDPIDNLEVIYLINNSDPNILIKKNLIDSNASFGISKDFTFNITAENVGNNACWGVPTMFPLSLEEMFTLLAGPLAENLMEDMWEVISIEYPNQYDSLEDFFNFDEDPRIFYFDTLGIGVIDSYYPNLYNISNLYPYNSNSDYILDLVFDAYPIYLTILDPDEVKELFTNELSIWNNENWKLKPGEKISYLYSNFSIDSYDTYTEFYSYNFTIRDTSPKLPALISGISTIDTDPYMALANDNESWIITSEEKFLDQHDLELVFLFQNYSHIDLTNNSLDRVSLIINYTDESNLVNLEVFNYSSELYIDLNPYLESRVNETSTFSFINENEDLDWLFDPFSPNNYSILVRVRATDLNQFNISINDFDIAFSYRNVNEYRGLSSRVIYASKSGQVEYLRRSNSISLSTHNMSSIVAYSQLSNYTLKVGDLVTYSLKLKNLGSTAAQELNVSILFPGIIKESNDFTVDENYLRINLKELAPMEEKELNFTFYVPNSESIFSTLINYNNPEIIQNRNTTKLISKPNEVYLSAYVDYARYHPFVHSLEFFYNSSSLTPSIGDIFNISVNIKHLGLPKLTISTINISVADQFGDLINLNPEFSLNFKDIGFNNISTNNLLIEKKDWKGYLYPSINYIEKEDSRLFQIFRSTPLLLGTVNLSIDKTVSENQIEIGEIITVYINITNIGTICIKNITLKDIISFNEIYFDLLDGSLIKEIASLEAGESREFSYKIKGKTQSLYTLKAASIDYYFLSKHRTFSNEIKIKIIIPPRIQIYFILIPCILSLLGLVFYIIRTHKRRGRKYQIQRNELYIFKRSARDTILKPQNNLKEYLRSLIKQNNTSEKNIKRKHYSEGG